LLAQVFGGDGDGEGAAEAGAVDGGAGGEAEHRGAHELLVAVDADGHVGVGREVLGEDLRGVAAGHEDGGAGVLGDEAGRGREHPAGGEDTGGDEQEHKRGEEARPEASAWGLGGGLGHRAAR
jgi:hypothetical protein